MGTKIMVVEDDPAIITGIVDLLEGEGYTVCEARDGAKALDIYSAEKPDLILLDIMIPEKSGYDVCRTIRTTDSSTPILMLTAKGQEVDKVVGLELGADDYIVKPFGIHELLARVRAALRRSTPKSQKDEGKTFAFGKVTINPKTLEGKRGDEIFQISTRELSLLQEFTAHEGEVLDRGMLLDRVWGMRYEGTTRTLDQHIAKLRQKVEDDPANPKYILTVHGAGYRFVGEVK